jgi:hypothetical protein
MSVLKLTQMNYQQAREKYKQLKPLERKAQGNLLEALVQLLMRMQLAALGNSLKAYKH